jgi:hypothetical protein
VVRTPTGRTGQTRPRQMSAYPVHPAPPTPDRGAGPSL